MPSLDEALVSIQIPYEGGKPMSEKTCTHPVYAARLLLTHSSRCVEFHPLSWKYLAWNPGPALFPCTKTYNAVPTTGMRFKGRMIRARSSARGCILAKGRVNIFPSLAIASRPPDRDLISRPWATRGSWSRATRVPSKVSIRASSTRNDRDKTLVMAELSLSTKMAAEIAASGPLVKAMIAICGTYVKKNIALVTPTPRVIVRPARAIKGRHRSLWVAKKKIPWQIQSLWSEIGVPSPKSMSTHLERI